MRVLVCGDRYWGKCTCDITPTHRPMDPRCPIYRRHADIIFWTLEGMLSEAIVNYDMEAKDGSCYPSDENPGPCSHDAHYPLVLIEGEADGADKISAVWAHTHIDVLLLPFPANWIGLGKRAGPIRNEQMFREGKPTHVLAFHSDLSKSRGTINSLRIAKRLNIPSYVVGLGGDWLV